MVVAMADMGTTNHMCLDKTAFILYHRVIKLNVCMGNKTLALILSKGKTVFSFNGKLALVHNVLRVHALHNPLYSLYKHLSQQGCGFIEDESLRRLFVYFPSFTLLVTTTIDCHLSCKPAVSNIAPNNIDYVEP